uniref:Uncharacterized protein n=1 Tax=Aegilops tauschii TaxID=37682 RepID=M8C261_AEGTA
MLGAVLRGPASPIPPLFPRRAPLIHSPAVAAPYSPPRADSGASGCVRCVWDIYYDEFQDYQKALAAHSSASPAADPSGDSKASADEKIKS